MLYFWYVNAEWRYGLFAESVDEQFANCSVTGKSESSSFAIVIPFPPKQINNILALLYVWSLPDFYPVKNGTASLRERTHLVLYPTTKDDSINSAITSFVQENKQIQEMMKDCFGSFEIIPRDLPDKFDKYYKDHLHGQWVASGMTEMFYPMMTEIAPKKGFDFVLYHEHDTFPLRSDWLSKLRDAAFAPDSDFWFLGSQQRQKSAFGGRIHGHMNGNSLIRVNNECLRNFLKRVYDTYRFLPYDTSIMRYLVHHRHLREAQHIMPRMRYTEIIGNFADFQVRREDLLKKYPEMYLVHGKGYFGAMNEVLKLERFKSGLVNLAE